MEKRTVVITGGNSGLGYQCAKNIAANSKDYTVVLACRNREKAATATESLRSETGNPNVYSLELDLASLESIHGFHDAFCRENFPSLYALVCNAGLNSSKTQYTKDGFEVTFGVNHLGHYLLANLMLGQMEGDGRIVFVSSDMHNPPKLFQLSTPAFTNVRQLAYPEADGKVQGKATMTGYSMSKLCNILCAREMATRLAAETNKSITVNAYNPGLMTDTNFISASSNKATRVVASTLMTLFAAAIGRLGSAEKSGKALASLITEIQYKGCTGKYYDRGKDVKSSDPSYDKEAARKLWVESADMVQLKPEDTILSIT